MEPFRNPRRCCDEADMGLIYFLFSIIVLDLYRFVALLLVYQIYI